MSNYSIVRQVAKNLRYEEYSAPIGHEVTIYSVETARSDVLQGLQSFLPGHVEVGQENVGGQTRMLSRFSFLDIGFDVGKHDFGGSNLRGFALLRELGFAPKPEEKQEAKDLPDLPDEPNLFELLYSDIQEGQIRLRLYLQGELQPDRKKAHRLEFAEGYFPKNLTVKDCCIANAHEVWFWKHFYII